MTALLNIGMRALMANQAVLQTTGQNIANAQTPGYSRQVVQLKSLQSGGVGTAYVGSGVGVGQVERIHSDFLTSQAATAQGRQASDSLRSSKLYQLQDVFPMGTNGVGSAINDMINAMSDIATQPTDSLARNIFLTRANEVTARLHNMDSQISDLSGSLANELDDKINASNTLLDQIATLNTAITRSQAQDQPANELLDQREQLVLELNQFVQTRQILNDDGSVSLYAGNQTIVMGDQSAELSLAVDPNDRRLNLLQVTRGDSQSTLDENALGGGEVQALLTFQRQDLPWAVNQVGHLAMTLGLGLNQQHEFGLTLDNQPGTALFSLPTQVTGTSSSATAAGTASAQNPAMLVASDYRLNKLADGSIQLVRLADKSIHEVPDPSQIELDGLTFQVSALAPGESLLFKPYATAAGDIDTLITSPRELAMASQVQVALGESNAGTLSVTSLSAYQRSPALEDTVKLVFKSDALYDLTDANGAVLQADQSYLRGQAIQYNGWELTLNGTPSEGDSAIISKADASYVTRDAANATAMLNLRDADLVNGGKLTDGYSNLLSAIGLRAQGAGFAADVSKSIADNIDQRRLAVSAVNLDEEAAKLLQFQQAYQASAKIIQTAQKLMDTLLQELG